MLAVGYLAATMATADRSWAFNTWERWEQPLLSSQTRTPVQAYNEVQIEATFWLKSGAACTEPATCANPNSCFKGRAFCSEVPGPG